MFSRAGLVLSAFVVLFIIVSIIVLMRLRIKRYHYSSQFELFGNDADESSSSEIAEGASKYYDWDVSYDNDKYDNKYVEEGRKKSRENRGDWSHVPPRKQRREIRQSCRNCDIYQHPDIDKFVLKSSIPPCPDMREYAKKSMMIPCPPCENDTDGRIQRHDYLSREHCEKYKHSLFTDIESWISSFFIGPDSDKKNGKYGPSSYSYGWGTGYGTDNKGYNMYGGAGGKWYDGTRGGNSGGSGSGNGKGKGSSSSGGDKAGSQPGDINKQGTANRGNITVQGGMQNESPEDQQKDAESEQRIMGGWSNSKLGSGVFLGLPDTD
jgi:hypothetical protein